METLTRTRTVGGSLVVTIPKEIVKVEDLREGEAVVIKLKKVAKSGFGVIRGMRSFKKEDELTGQLEEK